MRKTFSTIQKFWEGIELDSSLLTGDYKNLKIDED